MRSELAEEIELEAALRELHEPRAELPTSTREAEEAALAAYDARYGSSEAGRSGAMAWLGWFELLGAYRFAVAAVVLFMTLAGACVLPTSYEVPLGLSLEIRANASIELPVKDIAQFVQMAGEAEEVDVLVRELVTEGEQQTIMQIRLWGQSFERGELELLLRERFPALDAADAQIEEQALEGEIETVWARRLAHQTFELALKETDLEQARAQLLLQLHEQGIEAGEVTIEVRDREDGHREVELRIEQRLEGEPDAAALERLVGPGFEWKFDPNAPERIELPLREEVDIERVVYDEEQER